MRYLGVVDFDLIGRLTIADYQIIIDAIEKRSKDEDRDRHMGAYLTSMAGERDEKGRPRFPTFSDFYEKKPRQQDDRFTRLKEYLRSKDE